MADETNDVRSEALQMSRDLTAYIDEQQQDPQEAHAELGDCIKMVAYCVWAAAWRKARNEQALDPEIAGQVDHLIERSDFLEKALYRHNWRNVSAVLTAFREAGLAGTADVAAFYTHVNHIPKPKAAE
jgi:hypothetical protein